MANENSTAATGASSTTNAASAASSSASTAAANSANNGSSTVVNEAPNSTNSPNSTSPSVGGNVTPNAGSGVGDSSAADSSTIIASSNSESNPTAAAPAASIVSQVTTPPAKRGRNAAPINTGITIDVKNTTNFRKFEHVTKTPLPAGETTTIICTDVAQKAMILSNFKQLNRLARNIDFEVTP